MEDRELIRQIQNGQKQYLNVIAEKYYNDIYYFCCYQTGSREDAYDLAQETFLRFIRYVDRYQYRNLKGYLLTIAMNLCRNYVCDTGKVPVLPELYTLEAGDRGEEETAASDGREYENRENSLLLAAALQAPGDPEGGRASSPFLRLQEPGDFPHDRRILQCGQVPGQAGN